jgi:hypothetical protein
MDFLSENQRKKWVQPSRCAPKWSKFSNHLAADRNFLYWAFLADRFSFLIIFVIFFSFPPVAVDGIKVETAGEVAGQDENDAGRCAKS